MTLVSVQEGFLKAAMKAVEGGMSIQQATEKRPTTYQEEGSSSWMNIQQVYSKTHILHSCRCYAIIYIDFVVSGICRKHSKK